MWFKRLLKYPELWLLSVAALLSRLVFINNPPSIVFDEVYFRSFAADYLSGHYFFDIHPPLVKLLFAGSAHLLGISPEQLASEDPAGIVLRVLPALAGAALVPLVYVLIRQFGLGRRVATLGALLVLLDNALLVESRLIVMDSLLLLAGIGAMSAYMALRVSKGIKRWAWVIVTAVLLGVLVSIKWSGLAIAGLIALAWAFEAIRRRLDWRRLLAEVTAVVAIVATIYIGSFMAHFSLLHHSGEGDAFMSDRFQSTLEGNPQYKQSAGMASWDKFIELNEEMYTAQSSLNGVEHPYASKWYTWPLQLRPVYYWQGAEVGNLQAHIYLLGNPVVWWGSTIGVLVALVLWLGLPRTLGRYRTLTGFLLFGYMVNFLPFAFIDRPMFLYHYLFALIFAVLLSCVLLALLFDWQAQKYGRTVARQTSWGVAAAALLAFLYFIPVSYGVPLTAADLQRYMWLPGWR